MHWREGGGAEPLQMQLLVRQQYVEPIGTPPLRLDRIAPQPHNRAPRLIILVPERGTVPACRLLAQENGVRVAEIICAIVFALN